MFRKQVLALAANGDVPIEGVVLALADILGFTAAKLDNEHGQRTIDDKLNAFCVRVGETYERVRQQTTSEGRTAFARS